jgi:hypothetical protein
MDDETRRRGEKVQAAAGKLGLKADSYVENEWDVHKGDTQLGKLYYFPFEAEEPDKELWLTLPGVVDSHETLEDALAGLAQLSRQMVFTVYVKFDGEPGVTPDREHLWQVAQAINEAVGAIHDKLITGGLHVEKVMESQPKC